MNINVSTHEWRPKRFYITCADHYDSPEAHIFQHCMEVFDKPEVNDSQKNRDILAAMLSAHNCTVTWVKPIYKKVKRNG